MASPQAATATAAGIIVTSQIAVPRAVNRFCAAVFGRPASDVLMYALPLLAARGRLSLLGFTPQRRDNVGRAFAFLAQLLLARSLLEKGGSWLRTALRLGPKQLAVALAGLIMRWAKRLPIISGIAAKEQAKALSSIRDSVLGAAPDIGASYPVFPREPLQASDVARQLELAHDVQDDFKEDKSMGGIYHEEGDALSAIQMKAMETFSASNALYPAVFPGLRKFESEIISMVVGMVGGDASAGRGCGVLTSGGTESVIMAMLAHREYYRDVHGIVEPEIIACTSAHSALDKACHYFGIRLVHVEPDPRTMAVTADAMRREITSNTICLYTSAPSFPHGVIDPIPEIAALAQQHGIGCHVDNCLGGVLLSALQRQGLVTDHPFDLRVPGVTSISVDLHKYGFGVKGASVVVYRSPELRRCQYTTVTDWSGGLYATHGMGGSRGGHVIAATWATCLSMGDAGYERAAKTIHETWKKLRVEIAKIPGIRLMGRPDVSVIAFTSDEFDIYKVADEMKSNGGFDVPRMQRPTGLHICVNTRTANIVDAWLESLRAAAIKCRDFPAQVEGGMAGIYGQASIVPDRSVVQDILKGYLDTLLMVKA